MNTNRALLIFVDGLGMGADDPLVNPVHGGACPTLERLLREHAVPIDATLGVPGTPQSATGTTTILTGINAAHLAGRHVEGFPGVQLRDLIREHSIFKRLAAMGLTSSFANAYFVDEVSEVEQRRLKSVTTVAALSAFGSVPVRDTLERNEAVYHDLTRESLRQMGYTGPLVSPAESARHLILIAHRYHLTLFEYFQTDRAGHDADPARARKALSILDEFLGALLPLVEHEGILLILTSDHGNIEDSQATTHTINPVPFVALGPGGDAIRPRVKSILDITPSILEWFSQSK